MNIAAPKLYLVKLFERVIEITFAVMLLFITLSIIVGTLHLFERLTDLVRWQDPARHYVGIVSELLTLFILVELSRSLADYFTAHRLRMTFIVDGAIVFVLRDIVVRLFEEKNIRPGNLCIVGAARGARGCQNRFHAAVPADGDGREAFEGSVSEPMHLIDIQARGDRTR